MSSMFLESVRKLLEKDLVCPKCGAANDPTLIFITVDINGIACCGTCGCGGSYQAFQFKEKR